MITVYICPLLNYIVSSTKPLKECDLNELQIVLWDARCLWNKIGRALQLEPSMLETIASCNSNNDDDCFKEMLQKWLCMGTPNVVPCWKVLANALRSSTIAAQVEEDSTGMCIPLNSGIYVCAHVLNR